jgi:hypothetical protein
MTIFTDLGHDPIFMRFASMPDLLIIRFILRAQTQNASSDDSLGA